MDILSDFLDPIPLPVMGLILFGFAFLWVLSRVFRFPPNFARKEELREEIRYRLFSETIVDEPPQDPAADPSAEGGEAAPKEEQLAPNVSELPPLVPPSSANITPAEGVSGG